MTWSQYVDFELMRFAAALCLIATIAIVYVVAIVSAALIRKAKKAAKRNRGKRSLVRQGYGLVESPRWLRPEDMSCMTCDLEKRCQFAWDAYNTDGDCLEEK